MSQDYDALTPPMTEDEVSAATRECPQCHTPTFIAGQGSQMTARLIVDGNAHDSGLDGSVTRYTCRRCAFAWNIRWPNDTIPMA